MLSSITTILAFSAALAQAIPSEEEAQEHRAFGSPRFSLPAVHNPHFVRNGTASLLKAYRKYGLTPAGNLPPAAANALSKRQDSDTTASPGDGGLEYLIPVKVGGQLVNLDLDTGSADLYVATLYPPSSLLDSKLIILFCFPGGCSHQIYQRTNVRGTTTLTPPKVAPTNHCKATRGILDTRMDQEQLVLSARTQSWLVTQLCTIKQSSLQLKFLPSS